MLIETEALNFVNAKSLRKRGSIELACSLCAEIEGRRKDDLDGIQYEDMDIAEILSAEVVRLRSELIGLRSGYRFIKKYIDEFED